VGGALYIQAMGGGSVLLPQLAVITPVTRTQVLSTGSGSLVDLSSLTSFSGNPDADSLTVNNGSSLLDPDLNYFSDVNLSLNPTDTFTLAPNQTFASTTGAGTTVVTLGTLVEPGSLTIPDNAAITLTGALHVDGQGVLSPTPTGSPWPTSTRAAGAPGWWSPPARRSSRR
jgi:hypothetical protein